MERIPAVLLVLLASCGSRDAAPDRMPVTGSGTIVYNWREGDTWRYLAWALLDSDDGAGHETLALMSGHQPGIDLPAGTVVSLPLDPAMQDELEARLASAALVRTATSLHDAGDAAGSAQALTEAVEADPGWSVPRFDLALLMVELGSADSAREVLEPVADRPRASALLGLLEWEDGDVLEARERLEVAIASDEPPAEALASAAIAYMVTGDTYLANRLWMRLLQDPSAPGTLRLMAVHFCLLQEDDPDRF